MLYVNIKYENEVGKVDRKTGAKILFAAGTVLVLGCVIQNVVDPVKESCEKQIFAMNTIMTFEAYGKNAEEAVDAAIKEVNRLDALLSTGNEKSEVFALNQSGTGFLGEDAILILDRALDIYEKTGGVFDCTIYPVMQLWGFTSGEYRVPEEEELKQVLNFVDSSKISITDQYEVMDEWVEDGEPREEYIGKMIQLDRGQEIDFGGIAKGYASDRAIEIFEEYNVKSGLVSLGGNVKTLNCNPEGRPWAIGIRDPLGENGEMIAAVAVENQAVVTSGGYERYFEEAGETYIHIIDPKTGRPAESGLISVTVISEDGMLADALSTALYIMGEEEGEEFWRLSGEAFEFVFVTEDDRILVSEGLEDVLTIHGNYEVVYK